MRVLRRAVEDGGRLEGLEPARGRGLGRLREQILDLLAAQGMERIHGFESLIEDFHLVDPRNHHGRGEAQSIVQALDGSHRVRLQQDAVGQALHPEDPDPLADQRRRITLQSSPDLCLRVHVDAVEL